MSLDYAAVQAYFVHINASSLAASTKRLRRQAVKARLSAALSSTDFIRQAKLEMMLRSLDHDSETKAPEIVAVAIPEERIVTQEQFDRLVAGTSRRTSLFLWFLYNTGCRVAEMCGARLDKCEDLGDMIRLTIMRKGKKERKVDIEKVLFEAIRSTFRRDLPFSDPRRQALPRNLRELRDHKSGQADPRAQDLCPQHAPQLCHPGNPRWCIHKSRFEVPRTQLDRDHHGHVRARKP
jgi:integrase